MQEQGNISRHPIQLMHPRGQTPLGFIHPLSSYRNKPPLLLQLPLPLCVCVCASKCTASHSNDNKFILSSRLLCKKHSPSTSQLFVCKGKVVVFHRKLLVNV